MPKHSITIPFLSCVGKIEERRWLQALQEALPDHRITTFHNLSDDEKRLAEVALVANPDPKGLADLPNLRWVQSLWAGVEKLIAELPNKSFEIVCMTDPQLAATMAEAVLAWVLYLHRDMPLYRKQQEKKMWQEHDVLNSCERTIGILGLGNLGKAASQKLVQQGFSVCGWSRSKTKLNGIETFAGPENLTKVLRRSGILVVLLPLTAQTHDLLNKETLAHLPKGASVINFARGQLINDNALLDCLDSGHLNHAVLDVFDTEPLPQTSPFWDHAGVTVLPHISAPTNMKTASAIAAVNINRFFETGDIPQSVDRRRGY